LLAEILSLSGAAMRLAMRKILLIAIAVLVVGGLLINSAQAQSDQKIGQWCAYFTGGPTDCEFATFEDCLQAIKGKTGLCVQNAQERYQPDQRGAAV
jgi:Protein of unknown function (DUF3551)